MDLRALVDKVFGGLFGSATYELKGDQASIIDQTPGLYERIFKKATPKADSYSPSPAPQQMQSPQVNSQPEATPQVQPTPQVLNSYTNTARNPNVSKYNISDLVRESIVKAAQAYDLPPELLFDIALQESSFNPTLENTTPEGQKVGVPKGLFQFTPDTIQTVRNFASNPDSSINLPENIDPFDPYINSLMAAYLISHGQLGRWNASQGVWGPQYSYDEVAPYYSQTNEEYIPTQNWKS